MLISGPLASSLSQDQPSSVTSSKPQQASQPPQDHLAAPADTVTLHHIEPPVFRPPASTVGGGHSTEPPVHKLPTPTIPRHEIEPPLLKPRVSTISDLHSIQPPVSAPPASGKDAK